MKNKYYDALAVLVLALTFAACEESTGPGYTTDDTAVTAVTTAAASAGPTVVLPEGADYGGETITFLTLENYNHNFRLCTEVDGDTLNDAAAERNNHAAERLNVTFEAVEVEDAPETFRQSIMAGEMVYDFILPHATSGVAGLVTDNLLYDWNALEYVDFSQPWWNGTMTESLGIGGKLFYASGDIVMTWQGMQTVIFNKSYLSGMDLEKSLYDTVFDGEWTMDYLNTIIKGQSKDVNGDGKMTEVDQYGLLDNKNTGYAVMYAADQRVTVPDADGYPVLTLNTERMVEIVNKYYSYIYSGETYLDEYSSTSYATSTYRDMLIEGRSFLTTLDVGGLYSYLREIEFDFGLMPMPKLDEAQEDYRVFCGAGLIGVPSNVQDPVKTSVVAEALAYYSYQKVRPAFFDIVLENKSVRDENSYRVLQLMHENKVFDFGFNFDTTGSAYDMLRNVVVGRKSTDFASQYSKSEKKIQNGFNKIIEAVKDLE